MNKVAIIGAGEMGLAIGKMVAASGYKVEFWDRDPRKNFGTKRLDETVSGADFVFICVPSWGIREALISVSPHISKKTIVVSLTKGVDANAGKFSDELMRDILVSGQPIAVLGGAMIAEEINQGQSVCGVLGSNDERVFAEVSKLFAKSTCRLEFTKDIHGVSVAGVMKNIYALGLGIADGLNLSPEAKEKLIMQAMKEMILATSIFGGETATVEGRAGREDLLKTGQSEHSRNHEVGVKIATNGETQLKSEGTVSLPIIFSMLGSRAKDFPLLNMLYEMVAKNSDPHLIQKFI